MRAVADQVAGRIGPNAITRIAEVLPLVQAHKVFALAGLSHYLHSPPTRMIHETEVVALHRALRQLLGFGPWQQVSAEAGRRTAAYLLAHRIPRAAQAVLRILPPRWAARALLRAIGAHAWTFAGSGQFSSHVGRTVVLEIRHNPLCRGVQSEQPCCAFYAAVFCDLFRALVHQAAQVTETHCEARADPLCRFEVCWPD